MDRMDYTRPSAGTRGLLWGERMEILPRLVDEQRLQLLGSPTNKGTVARQRYSKGESELGSLAQSHNTRRNVNMAKAKFPGKPPKTSQITRLRVSSYSNGSSSDSSRLVAQQAAFGLKLFHQHFAADDEVTHSRPFASFYSIANGLVI